MAYATAADLRAWLKISATTDDTQLGFAVARAQQYIETQTGRIFESAADTTRTFTPLYTSRGGDLIDPDTLQLDTDLCALTSITNGDGNAISTADVKLLPLNRRPAYAVRIVTGTATWAYSSTPWGAVSIVGRWAYSTTPPADIVDATLELGAHLYENRDQSSYRQAAVMSADGAPVIPPGMPSIVARAIKQYRRHS